MSDDDFVRPPSDTLGIASGDLSSSHPASGDPLEPPPLPIPPLPIPVVQAIRFCRTCGTPWEPDMLVCRTCDLQLRSRAESPTTDDITSEKRAIISSMALYFALLTVSLVTIAYFLITKNEYTLTVDFVQTSAMVLITTVWCLFGVGRLRDSLRVVPSFKWFALAALCAVPTFLIAHYTVSALEQFIDEPTYRYMDPYRAAGFGFGLAVLMVCVQPAIFEELAFRGFIETSLLQVLGRNEAIFVSAGMFAILHLSIPSIPHLFLIGAVLGWLRLKTGSMYPGMVMHFTHNFFVILTEQFGERAVVIVEHTFITTSEPAQAMQRTMQFLQSHGFASASATAFPVGEAPWNHVEMRRGAKNAARAKSIAQLPQVARVDYDRGRVSVAIGLADTASTGGNRIWPVLLFGILGATMMSSQYAGKKHKGLHQSMLTALAVGIERAVNGETAHVHAEDDIDAIEAEIKQDARRRNRRMWIIAGVVILLFLALIAFAIIADANNW